MNLQLCLTVLDIIVRVTDTLDFTHKALKLKDFPRIYQEYYGCNKQCLVL